MLSKSLIALHNHGQVTPENTLFVQSICADEINHDPSHLVNLFASEYGRFFDLGGLAGVPFGGKSAFRSLCRHMPVGE